jgi:hypothetical protein
LQKAYVGGRYEKEYSITLCELEKIGSRVFELKEVLKEYYQPFSPQHVEQKHHADKREA